MTVVRYDVFLFLYVLAFTRVTADSLSDFSNNLATDLGPLLTLFGDSITKQYLSESTTFLDYLIFALAPIGIITAIVSVIRVCGHSSLRAFVGRSQEGQGVVEAELCTSTSRDVCELFNRGGITRVLGKPSILELVYVPESDDIEIDSKGLSKSVSSNTDFSRWETNGEKAADNHQGSASVGGNTGLNFDTHGQKEHAKIFLSRQYFDYVRHDADRSALDWDWEQVDGDFFERPAYKHSTIEDFGPNPNLSLNVGIVKRPKWVFLAVAIIGVLLQGGVVAMASVGVWYLRWSLDEDDGSNSPDYAPIMFIGGTLLMAVGMWCCAFLIGQATREVHYRREPEAISNRSRLCWLQPGPQIIGDQSFDPYAYLEDTENAPLRTWTSSRKENRSRQRKAFELQTYVAALCVVVGYVMQFIGLRGMTAWISIAQLGVSLVMSILRSGLRMQRLSSKANVIEQVPDSVAGHELDWLSYRIADEEETETFGTRTKCNSGFKPQKQKRGESLTFEAIIHKDQQKILDKLLRIRVRLAHLTGHTSLCNPDALLYQKWSNTSVKVRTKAQKISTALCGALPTLFPRARHAQGEIVLQVHLPRLIVTSVDRPTQVFTVVLRPPSQSSQAGWHTNAAQIEAMLGLWMWSMVSRQLVDLGPDRPFEALLPDERTMWIKIISGTLESTSPGLSPGPIPLDRAPTNSGIEKNIALWLGSSDVRTASVCVNIDWNTEYSLSTLWTEATSLDSEVIRGSLLSWPSRAHFSFPRTRISGWDAIDDPDRDIDAKDQIRLLINAARLKCTEASLLDVCAQELFSAIVRSLSSLVDFESSSIVEEAGTIRLENRKVAALAHHFVQNDLGSLPDAIIPLIPALRRRLPSPDADEILSTVTTAAEKYRNNWEWSRAEVLMRWACEHFYPSEQASTKHICIALRATGELYRCSIRDYLESGDQSLKFFGIEGIKWLVMTYNDLGKRHAALGSILRNYQDIGDMFEQHLTNKATGQDDNSPTGPKSAPSKLLTAVQKVNRVEALYHLCFLTTEDFRLPTLAPILSLCVRNDWPELFTVFLEMKADPDGTDEEGRTAISYAAQIGHRSFFRQLLAKGAAPGLWDKHKRTPLLWAAEAGHLDIVKLLMATGYTDPNKEDADGNTPLIQAVRNQEEAVVEYLLDNGVAVDHFNRWHETAILLATRRGCMSAFELLLDRGADPDVADSDGKTALHAAAQDGTAEMLRILLDCGARVDWADNSGSTALHRASQNQHVEHVRILLKYRANIEASTTSYRTPLHTAVMNGCLAVVRILLENGADVNAVAVLNQTPLILAAEAGYEEIAMYLLEHGADFRPVDSNGHSALRLAAKNGLGRFVKYMRDNGAVV